METGSSPVTRISAEHQQFFDHLEENMAKIHTPLTLDPYGRSVLVGSTPMHLPPPSCIRRKLDSPICVYPIGKEIANCVPIIKRSEMLPKTVKVQKDLQKRSRLDVGIYPANSDKIRSI